jgi:hypothetical protein
VVFSSNLISFIAIPLPACHRQKPHLKAGSKGEHSGGDLEKKGRKEVGVQRVRSRLKRKRRVL